MPATGIKCGDYMGNQTTCEAIKVNISGTSTAVCTNEASAEASAACKCNTAGGFAETNAVCGKTGLSVPCAGLTAENICNLAVGC